MPRNKDNVHLELPADTRDRLYNICRTFTHRTMKDEILIIVEEREAIYARTNPVTISEGLNAWLLEESKRNATTPSAILQKIVEDYHGGLAYRDNKVERL